jgi:DNA-binding PadR family transcriptional regulator
MTIDEWPERLEHVTAGWIDQSRRERAEDRQLWRDTQQQINLLTRRMTDWEEQFVRFQSEADERFRQAEERDRKVGEGVNDLVSTVGELVQKPDAKG